MVIVWMYPAQALFQDQPSELFYRCENEVVYSNQYPIIEATHLKQKTTVTEFLEDICQGDTFSGHYFFRQTMQPENGDLFVSMVFLLPS